MSRYLCGLIFLFIILGTGSGFLHFHISDDNFSKKILELSSWLLEGNAIKADKSFRSLSRKKQTICKNLFEGLRLQNQKKFHESDVFLDKAFLDLRLNKGERSFSALQEDLLGARCLNAFLQKKYDSLKSDMKIFQNHFPESHFLNLFIGLFSYSQKDFPKAVKHILLWEKIFFLHSESDKRGWLACNVDLLFTKNLLPIIKAHCLIETGELAKGKSILQTHLDGMLQNKDHWDAEIYEQILLLLSRYHYLFSKNCFSLSNKITHYEMMIFYLNKVTKIDQKTIEQLIEPQDVLMIMEDLTLEMNLPKIKVLLDFIEFSEKHYNITTYENLIEKIHKWSDKENYHALLIHCLKEVSQNPMIQKFQKQLIKNLSDYMHASLQRLDIEKIRQYFSYLEILQPEVSFTQRITMSTEDMQKILLCGASSEQLKNYLSLWTKETTSSKEKESLFLSLLEIIHSLWRQGQESCSLNILEILLSMNPFQETSEEKILHFIKMAYQYAESLQNISGLCQLDEFVFNHRLPRLRYISSETLANLIADAEYFYMDQDYEKVFMYCNWLSKIDPDNNSLLRLKGLCFFKQKNYKEAMSYFDRLSGDKKDTKVRDAIGKCIEELSLREF